MAYLMLDEGTYKGKVVDWGFNETPNGTAYFYQDVVLTAREGDDGSFEDTDKPYRRTLNYWLNSPDNVERSLKNLNYLGFKGGADRLGELDPAAEGGFNFRNMEVFVNVKHGTDQRGQEQENVNLSRRRRAASTAQKQDILSRVARYFPSDQGLAAAAADNGQDYADIPF